MKGLKWGVVVIALLGLVVFNFLALVGVEKSFELPTLSVVFYEEGQSSSFETSEVSIKGHIQDRLLLSDRFKGEMLVDGESWFDETSSCVIVQKEAGYVLWPETKIHQGSLYVSKQLDALYYIESDSLNRLAGTATSREEAIQARDNLMLQFYEQ